MNRRGFLRGLIGGVAVAAAATSFPFRVFSFPTEIVRPKFNIIIDPLMPPGRIAFMDSRIMYETLLKKFYEPDVVEFLNGPALFCKPFDVSNPLT